MRGRGKAIGSLAVVLVMIGLGAAAYMMRRLPASAEPRATARDYYDQGDWKGAEAEARAVLTIQKEDRDALRILARASARQGRDDVARRIFQRLGVGTMEPEDHLVLAMGLNREGRTRDARETLQFAIHDDRFHSESRYELAKIEVDDERWEEASKLVRSLMPDPVWKVRAGVLLGVARGLANDPKEAVDAFKNALGADSSLAKAVRSSNEVRKLLARAYLRVGKPNEAGGELDAVLKAEPDPEASWLLSRVFLQKGDITAAENAIGASQGFNADHPEAFEPAVYIGAARCAECHREIHASQQNSHHAQTFHRGEDLGDFVAPDMPVADPHLAGVNHTIKRRDKAIEVVTQTPKETRSAIVEYVLGSGNHGRSFVGKEKDEAWRRELRLSQFSKNTLWDLTTGHVPLPADPHDAVGLRQSDDALRSCLGCHTTNPRAILDRSGPESFDRAISCERCHGPGGNHVEAISSGFSDFAIGRPRSASHSAVNTLCGQCHGAGIRKIPEDDEKSLLRFQATTLPKSRCFTATKGALSCVSCHDPHANAEKSPAFYESKCLACHSNPATVETKASETRAIALPEGSQRVMCPVDAKQGCIGCHMPLREGTMPHSSFTDHRIQVHRPKPAR